MPKSAKLLQRKRGGVAFISIIESRLTLRVLSTMDRFRHYWNHESCRKMLLLSNSSIQQVYNDVQLQPHGTYICILELDLIDYNLHLRYPTNL